MIFLKRRALMTRFSFNYKTASGVGSLVLEKCAETFFKQFKLLGNSVQVTTKGVNLIPFPYVDKDMTKKDVTFTVKEDGGIKVYGTASESVVFVLAIIDYGKESIFNNSTGNGKIISGGKDNVSIEYHGVTKKTYLSIEQGKAVNTIIYPQLQNGSVATPYEQYTGGKPSPSLEFLQEIKNVGKWNEEKQKYEIDVQVTGKNLFNISNYPFSHNGETIIIAENEGQVPVNKGINITEGVIFDENARYCISYDSYKVTQANSDWTTLFTFYYTDDTYRDAYVNMFYGDLKKYFNSLPDKRVRNVAIRNPWKVGIEISKVQIEKSEMPTDYEPYREPQTVTLSLDQPLRGIGKYKDEVTKDGIVRKVYEQKIKKEQVSMNEYDWGTKNFRCYITNEKKLDSSENCILMSNISKKFDIYKGFNIIYWVISEEDIKSIGVTETDSREMAFEKIKTFVNNNNIVVQYPLEEPIIEPLSEETKIALESLYTNDGTTIITVDGGEVETGIEVEYAVKE